MPEIPVPTELLTLTQAAKVAPGRPSTNCLWRWCRRGVLARTGQRLHLEHVRVGGKIFTSIAWLEEFGRQVAAADAEYFTAAAQGRKVAARQTRTLSQQEQKRQERIACTRRELDAAGL